MSWLLLVLYVLMLPRGNPCVLRLWGPIYVYSPQNLARKQAFSIQLLTFHEGIH